MVDVCLVNSTGSFGALLSDVVGRGDLLPRIRAWSGGDHGCWRAGAAEGGDGMVAALIRAPTRAIAPRAR